MGSNRVVPVTATIPTQTHSPSGLSSHPVLDMSSLVKIEPSTHMEAAVDHCHSENWAESYQDLSSWCSGISASSPATCQSPVIGEIIVNDIEFHGESDFDLRKSEEIASIPLEEDNSFNLWASGSVASTVPFPAIPADTSVEKSNFVLLKDCWWSEVEKGKVLKELESVRPQAFPRSRQDNSSPDTVTVKEEVADSKENMNPLVTSSQYFLTDPVKMAELQRRCERLASLAHHGMGSKTKAADLMKILQEQIAALNKKKYRSPAAVADLHNYSKGQAEQCMPGTSTAGTFTAHAGASGLPGATGDIFQSDPFEGLFSMSDSQVDSVEESTEFQMQPVHLSSNQSHPQIIVSASKFEEDCYELSAKPAVHTSPGTSSTVRGSDLFFEAHNDIMRDAGTPQPNQSRVYQNQQCPPSQQMLLSTNPTANILGESASHCAASGKSTLTIQLPLPRPPELDINLDNVLFGSLGLMTGTNKVPGMSTPEVLKPLVDTPDPESFDLLSYLCDDKLNTPPVSLENNPFHFPPPTTSTSVTEHKSNDMGLKPLIPQWSGSNLTETDVKSSSVVVETKPQILPSVLSDDDDDEEEERIPIKTEDKRHTVATEPHNVPILPRPSRMSRKRKYSEEEFVLSPTTSEDRPKSTKKSRRNSSKYDSDEEFTLSTRKSKKSLTIIEEDEEETVKTRKKKMAGKRSERTVSTSSESDRYRELRDRNNEASRKSRLTRKAREQDLAKQAEVLTKENRVLKVKVDEMENLVKRLREALLLSMTNKRS